MQLQRGEREDRPQDHQRKSSLPVQARHINGDSSRLSGDDAGQLDGRGGDEARDVGPDGHRVGDVEARQRPVHLQQNIVYREREKGEREREREKEREGEREREGGREGERDRAS